MIAFAAGILLGAVIAILVMELVILPGRTALYEKIYGILEAHRDEAKNEAEVFRGLLFPVLAKSRLAASASSPVRPQEAAAGAPNQATTAVSPLQNRRVPWRIRFKQAVAAHNTPQKRRDALIEALETQIPAAQEKQNV